MRNLVIILLVASLILGTGFAAGQEEPYKPLPGEPAPLPASEMQPLSTEEGVNLAVEWAKWGQQKQPDYNKLVNTAIGAISVAYPPAGVALAAVWGIIQTMSSSGDTIGEAISVLNQRVDKLEADLKNAQLAINKISNQLYSLQNEVRLRELLDRIDKIKVLMNRLHAYPADDTTAQQIAYEAQLLVNRFLPIEGPDRKMWYWSDVRVGPSSDRKQPPPPQVLPDAFRVLPMFSHYVDALLLYMAAVEYAYRDKPWKPVGLNPPPNPHVPVLLQHATFLSVRPYWREGGGTDDQMRLPEQVMQRVISQIQVTTDYPINGLCNARYWTVDYMRLVVTPNQGVSFRMPTDKDLCVLSRRLPKDVSAQEQQQRMATVAQNPVYGSQAMALWEQWGGRMEHFDPKEDELERGYGLDVMALMADKLERLAKTGTTREQFIGTFDFTYYHPEWLYMLKPNGELLWQKHTIGIDENTPQETKDWLKSKTLSIPVLTTRGVDETVPEVETRQGAMVAELETLLPEVESRAVGRISQVFKAAPLTARPSPTLNPNVQGLPPPPPPARIFHKMEGPKLVNTGWQNFREVIPGGFSSLYGLTADGVLKWYRHDGLLDGTMNWKGPIDVGIQWNMFTKVIAGGDGVLYGILPNGVLRWYRHTDVADTATPPKWAGPVPVGTDWHTFVHVFSTGEGVIYGVAPDGRLLWYRHNGYLTGQTQWEGPKQVGTGWGGFKRIFSPGEGMIYALTQDGKLLWYQHEGYQDGTFRWRGPTQIGAAWDNFTLVFPSMAGIPHKSVVR